MFRMVPKMAVVLACMVLASAGCSPDRGPSSADVASVYVMPPDIETRWVSFENPRAEKGKGGIARAGRKGSPFAPLKAGESRTLAQVDDASGTVRRIWLTMIDRSPLMLRGIRMDFYWDGSAKPAASAPLGDFFGMGLGQTYAFESEYFSSPEGRSFNSVVPMPFKKGMKITITNNTKLDNTILAYDVDYTLGDKHGPDTLYFHACFNRQNPTQMQKDYEFLPKITGRGRYLGVNVGVKADSGKYFNSWWGEGECKIFLDGDTEHPTLCGTGTEDYVGSGWFLGAFSHRYQGCPLADKEKMWYCFYRLHVPDPVYFRKDIRVTMQQIGCWLPDSKPKMVASGNTYYAPGAEMKPIDWNQGDGKNDYGMFERQDDWSSCAYFYLDRPENDLPPLMGVEERTAGII